MLSPTRSKIRWSETLTIALWTFRTLLDQAKGLQALYNWSQLMDKRHFLDNEIVLARWCLLLSFLSLFLSLLLISLDVDSYKQILLWMYDFKAYGRFPPRCKRWPVCCYFDLQEVLTVCFCSSYSDVVPLGLYCLCKVSLRWLTLIPVSVPVV